MYEELRVRETGTRSAEKQNRKGKRPQTIYGPMLRVLSYVSLACKVNNERMSYRKYRVCLCSEGISPEEREDVRVSWHMRGEGSRGCGFLPPFLVWDVKRGRRERQWGRISWYPWDAIAAELKMQIFLCYTGLNVSSCFTWNFSCLAIQAYRLAAVCFCYTLGERSLWRSHRGFEVWRKNKSYLLCYCLTSFY